MLSIARCSSLSGIAHTPGLTMSMSRVSRSITSAIAALATVMVTISKGGAALTLRPDRPGRRNGSTTPTTIEDERLHPDRIPVHPALTQPPTRPHHLHRQETCGD